MTGDHKALFEQWVELGRRMTEDELRDILVRASKALDKARARGPDQGRTSPTSQIAGSQAHRGRKGPNPFDPSGWAQALPTPNNL